MRVTCLLVYLLLFATTAFAQLQMDFNHPSSRISESQYNADNRVQVNVQLHNLSVNQITDDGNDFVSVQSNGLMNIINEGSPSLPQITKLYYVPKGETLNITYLKFDEETINLKREGFNGLVLPSIGSVSKGREPKTASNVILKDEYYENAYIYNNPIRVKYVGIMRNIAVYEVTVNPIAYNPAKGKLLVRTNLSFEIEVSGSQKLPGSNSSITNKLPTIATQGLAGKNQPVGQSVLIVSPLKYKETLQQYIIWKKQLGYTINEAYIGEDIVSSDKETIKSYIESFYNNPAEEENQLSYLVIVGDVVDIPSWSVTTIDPHVTDLYYAEFTNDYLPEIYYGRMSVNDTIQLNNIINKILFTEKAEYGNNTYQDNHLLVSGVDSYYAPKYGNGALNYFIDYYSNAENGITPKYYLYRSDSPISSDSPSAKQSIIDDFNNGVSVAYYTAHCSSKGWSNPEFESYDLSKISNEGMYPLMIGNCCESAKFNLTSFAEDVIRLKDRGAVTYIGASDFSYWDEDYFWGIGATNFITSEPEYEQTGLGVWDAWFHSHDEQAKDRAQTAAQVLTIGNLAVQASNTTEIYKKYYWEVYHIIGDPLFVPANKNYNQITASFPPNIMVGQSIYQVQAPVGSVVSLTENNKLIAKDTVGSSGLVELVFEPLQDVGNDLAELVVSHFDYKPIVEKIDVTPPNGPYVVFSDVKVNDESGNNDNVLDYDEKTYLDLTFTNLGVDQAQEVNISLYTDHTFVKSLTLNENKSISSLNAGEAKTTMNAFYLELIQELKDSTWLNFYGTIEYNDTISRDFSFKVMLFSPELELNSILVDKNGVGNLDGILQQSEVATLQLEFVNAGYSQVSNTIVNFNSLNSEIIELPQITYALGGFKSADNNFVDLTVQLSDTIVDGAEAIINYEIIGGFNEEYKTSGSLAVIVGVEPKINIGSQDVVKIINGRFYDSGGPDENYGNNENNTITFLPYYEDQALFVNFQELNIESKTQGDCWDFLEIYDGKTVNDSLIGSFCSNNFDSSVYSQNPDGALTFRFISDDQVTKTGWEAFVHSNAKRTINFEVSNGSENIKGANVVFGRYAELTSEQGTAVFSDITDGFEYEYTIEYDGYNVYSDKIILNGADTTIKVLLNKLPEICFSISSGTDPVIGARVLFNGIEKFTDEIGKVVYAKQIEGTYSFYIQANGYVDTSGYVTVPTYDICYYINIRKLQPYKLELFVVEDTIPIESAVVSIANMESVTNTQGIAVFDSIYPGIYDMSIVKSGYKFFSSTYKMHEENQIDTVMLVAKTYSAIFNVYNKGQRVQGATVRIGNQYAYTSDGGQAAFIGLRPQENIEYVITHPDFNTYVSTFSIVDETVLLDVELVVLGLNEMSLSGIDIFPNPLGKSNELFVESGLRMNRIVIYSVNGALVYSKKCNSKKQNIDLSMLEKGIYLLQVYTDETIGSTRLIIE